MPDDFLYPSGPPGQRARTEEGPHRSSSYWYDRLVKFFASHWDELPRVMVQGLRSSGENMVVRFLASRATLYVRVHIQHDGPGGGGEAYDANIYVSDTRVDCRENRQQDTTITRDTGFDYFVWFIPEFLEGDASTYTRYDGETGEGEDKMAFVALGANSEKIIQMIVEMENLNEKLERLLTQAACITELVLDPGEK